MLQGTIKITNDHVQLYDADGALQAQLARSPKLIWLCAMLCDVEDSTLQAELSAVDVLDISRWLLQKQAHLLLLLRHDIAEKAKEEA